MNVIKIRRTGKRNPRISITGLSEGDVRLIANALYAGAFMGADRGGPVSDAVVRLERALRVPLQSISSAYSHVDIVGGTSDASILFDEVDNLPAGIRESLAVAS